MVSKVKVAQGMEYVHCIVLTNERRGTINARKNGRHNFVCRLDILLGGLR